MKYSGIGGQAVMEGIMMKNQDSYAVAVRTPDNEIVVDVQTYTGFVQNKKVKNIPIVRGVINFIDSLVLGMKSLTYSASFFEEEEVSQKQEKKQKKAKKDQSDEKKNKNDRLMMGLTVTFSIVLAVAIFMILPYGISLLFQQWITSSTLILILEGIIRLGIFIGYVSIISLMPDIKRVYMYHGAEHKCINCIEQGMDLTVKNVRKSSRFHKRCGTSFLVLVILISIVFFMFIRVELPILRLALRLLLVPVIAGVAFEFIRLAGRKEHFLLELFSKPGFWLQKITTKEPDDEMIEVAIASVNAVFDWKEYIASQEESSSCEGCYLGE